MRLQNKVAVVTGGSSGMGEAIALLFAEEGAAVVVADIDQGRAAALAARVGATGKVARAIACDVANEGQVRDMVGAVLQEFGKIDVLVNCVGITESAAAEETTAELWRRAIDVNLTGVFFACREAGRAMIRQRAGKIVNIGSIVSLGGAPYFAAYTAAKHGVLGLTRALAVEWGKYNISVNCICPGPTLTPMLRGLSAEFQAERVRRIPLGRLAEPADQARMALFLASPDSDYLNGAVISVDGGIAATASSTSDAAIRTKPAYERG